ncbi:MAG: 2-C-methyl-D-erythritol 4-phosphate cytidylyltransferase [Rhodoluna sp.]
MSGVAVILVAAGDGTRLGQGVPKALVKVQGRTLLEHALERILKVKDLRQIVIASHENHIPEFKTIADSVIKNQVAANFTPGGTSRQGSIWNALQEVSNEAEIVLVHDAARCFAPTELFDRVADSVREFGVGVVPVLPIADTIKQVEKDVVLGTVDRENLRSAQTPQGFVLSELFANYEKASADFTDDAALMQSFGEVIHSVAGDAMAFKITHPEDLDYARGLTKHQRTGIGTDVHRFSEDSTKKLFLGTICWEGEIGLDGHSDGDALSHAIVDALLAAAGLGDIGSIFGTDDPRFAGSNGKVFIEGALERLSENGWSVVNVSVQLIGNRPKVAPMRQQVEKALTEIIGAPVSLGATTTDGLGFLGNSEGVAAVATALIESRL